MGSHILHHCNYRGNTRVYRGGGRRGERCNVFVLLVRRYFCGPAVAGAFRRQKTLAMRSGAARGRFHGMEIFRAPATVGRITERSLPLIRGASAPFGSCNFYFIYALTTTSSAWEFKPRSSMTSLRVSVSRSSNALASFSV